MEGLFSIELEACDAQRNRHRYYVIEINRDLLNDWTVTVRYGRIGQSLRVLRFTAADAAAASAQLQSRLKRRLTAPQRIGCAYRIANCAGYQEFQA